MIGSRLVIRKFVSLVGLALLAAGAAMADTNYSLRSPDNRIDVAIRVAKKITYDVSLNGRLLMKDSTLGINIEGKALAENPQVKSAKKDSVDKVLEPVVRQKSAKIREHYNELRLEMDGSWRRKCKGFQRRCPLPFCRRPHRLLSGRRIHVLPQRAQISSTRDVNHLGKNLRDTPRRGRCW